MNVQIKHSLAYLQDLVIILASVFAYYFISAKVGIKSCKYIYQKMLYFTCIWLNILEPTAANAGWLVDDCDF